MNNKILGVLAVFMLMLTSVSAYTYDEAKDKVDWSGIKDGTVLLYTKESSFLYNSFGDTKSWSIYIPSKIDFEGFVNSKCFDLDKWNNEGKSVYVFKETKDNCEEKKFNTIMTDANIASAYSGLKFGLGGKFGNGAEEARNKAKYHRWKVHGIGTNPYAVKSVPASAVVDPNVPTGLTAVAGGTAGGNTDNRAWLNWNPVTDATSYEVYSDASYPLNWIGGTSVVVTGLSQGTTYGFTVTSLGSWGESAETTPMYVTTTSAP